MKSLLKIALGLFAGMSLLTGCQDSDDDPVLGLLLGTKEITVDAVGAVEKVEVTAGGKWVAKTNQPWVKVMPANGVGSTVCEIVIDTTLANQVRHAVITFIPQGQAQQELNIHQTGYGKMIGLSESEVSVANMGTYGKRWFEVIVTTNVEFKVDIPADVKKWLTLEKTPDISLDYGARPRTTKMRFNWAMNTDPVVRTAEIAFVPLHEQDTLEQETVLVVKQDAAPEITDSRMGDSIALLIINEKLQAMNGWNTSEKMDYWAGITLWEKTDEGVMTEMIGRVRAASFQMMNTKEELPAELAHLKYAEKIVISGNTNTLLLPDNFTMGTALAELGYLKHLIVRAYGLTTINPAVELKNSRKNLESLDISSNNFTTLPTTISKTYFPKLKYLNMGAMRRYGSLTDMKNGWKDNAGMKVDASSYAFKNLLKWEELVELSLSYCYIYGQLPDMNEVPKYTDTQIAANDTLKSATNIAFLKTIPRVLPNARRFAINLNFLTGSIPDWILYHPRFAVFNPYSLICTQESGYDPDGNVPKFTNEPPTLDYFYEFYPAAKPSKTE